MDHAQNTVVELFARWAAWGERQFTERKAKDLHKRSLEKYQTTLKYLADYFGSLRVDQVGEQEADDFIDWLQGENLSELVIKERLTLIKAAWEWGEKQKRVESNPWSEAPKRIKVPPKQAPKPFTREEIGAIIQGFRMDCYHYADFVEFLFGTGCRTSEAIGLRWQHVSDDCTSVWIGESLTRGERKATKTNRARTITTTSRLQSLLQARRPVQPDPEQLVFTSPKGGAIDDHNFRNRAWVKILMKLEIDYRKPYTTRHTLISHALNLGQSPLMVAQLTGHDVQTLFENYAGSVNSRPRLPELFTPAED
ncbi:MAG: hypothetical protein OHK0012_26030 [Synechococcales cyanobacterium]